jgi:hypothetical protein
VLYVGESEPLVPGSLPAARDQLCSRAGCSLEQPRILQFSSAAGGMLGLGYVGAAPIRGDGEGTGRWTIQAGSKCDLLIPPRATPSPSAARWRAEHSYSAAMMAPPVTSVGSRGSWPSSPSRLGGGVSGRRRGATGDGGGSGGVAFGCCNCCISML